MKIIDILKISITSLRRSKIRSFLTSFAVFIGVFVIIFLVSLSFGAQDLLLSQITNQFDLRSIIVTKQGALNLNFLTTTAEEDDKEEPRVINQDAIDEISKMSGVEFVSPIISQSGKKFEFKDKDFDKRVINSASGAGWDLVEDDLFGGKALAGKITELAENEIIVTQDIANAFEKTSDELIGQTIIISDQGGLLGMSQSKPAEPREYLIVGVSSSVRDFGFILSLEHVVNLAVERNGYEDRKEYLDTVGYQTVYVKARNESDVKDLSNNIKGIGFDTSTLEDILIIFNTFFNIIPIIFTIIGAIAVFVAAIGIINTMVMSVFERTKEIGVMKAVGAKNINIVQLFITEAGLIGFMGGLFAVVVSLSLMFIINAILVNNILPNLGIENIDQLFITPLWLIIVTVALSTFVGILSGLYPAVRASRLDPVKALRYE